MLLGCDNVILGNRWNLRDFINPIYYHEIYSFNAAELHKTYSLYKSERGTPPFYLSQSIVCQIEGVMQQCGGNVRILQGAFEVSHFGAL